MPATGEAGIRVYNRRRTIQEAEGQDLQVDRSAFAKIGPVKCLLNRRPPLDPVTGGEGQVGILGKKRGDSFLVVGIPGGLEVFGDQLPDGCLIT